MRRWSIRHAAGRAGVAPSTWMRIERGELRTDRYMISDLAAALECSIADLTGQPIPSSDRSLTAAHARVIALWRVLVEVAPDEPPRRPVLAIPALSARMDLIDSRRAACDFAGVAQLLPDLLLDLHAATRDRRRGRAARLLFLRATYSAASTLRSLGYLAEATIAAERCRQVAEQIDQAVPLAVADWARAHVALSSGSFGRALTLVSRAADDLERNLEAPTAPEVLGMLHLSTAMAVLADHRTDDAFAHINEAAQLAARTGETTSWNMCFGPSNVALWRMGLEVDTGQPAAAIETANNVRPATIPSVDRQSAYYLDFGRALADIPGRDRDAVRMLLQAERVAPQRIRSSVSARDTARFLLDRSRRAEGGSELLGLCERLGVHA